MARRKFDVFSMSFLDAICCGFGSLVLLYVLISAQGKLYVKHETDAVRAQALLVEQQVLEGRRNLVTLRNALALTDNKSVLAQGAATQASDELAREKTQAEQAQSEALARKARLERLKADLAALEEGAKRLEANAKRPVPGGESVRPRAGDGNRLYLTGLRVSGQRVLFLIDASASMLDETVVNILRTRNMADSVKLRTEKWRQTVATVDWLTTQLQPTAQVQFYTFNTQPKPLVVGSMDRWLTVDAKTVAGALEQLRKTVPIDGTSLENAFAAANRLQPAPDLILLVTDGLPTQGASPPLMKKIVDGDDRLKFFEKAVRILPKRVPVSTVLMPMEGDPQAPYAYWRLANATGGGVMSPAKDWP
jgi:hypothetical protein